MATQDPDPPSWLREPCPDWCTRVHAEHDHPEDRVHRDAGTLVPVILGVTDPVTLRPRPLATELVVHRARPIPDPTTWVVIQEAEGQAGLTLSSESASRLGRALPG